jgi:membrane protease YdiL (CAAX protease family)
MEVHMTTRVKLAVGVLLAAGVFVLASRVVPALPPVRAFIEARDWLTRTDVTQLVFLVGSAAAMLALGRDDPAAYGLLRARWKDTGRAVAVSAVTSLGVLVLTMIVVSAFGPPQGEHVGMNLGPFAKVVVSVWLLASVAEEMLFRGLLLGALSSLRERGWRLARWRISLPVTVAAVAFGLIHLGLLRVVGSPMAYLIVVMATLVGLIAGHYREKTGSIVPAIAVHMTFNVVAGGIPMLLMWVMSTRGLG